MKILLLCNQGMSTSALVANMRKCVDDDTQIDAHPITNYEEAAEGYDVVLLGPQIRYKLDEVKTTLAAKGIGVDVIDPASYGMLNGQKVVDQAKSLVK